MSAGFPDCVPADAHTVSDGSLGVALVAVEPDAALLGHGEQIKHCDHDQERRDQLPQHESGGGDH